MKKSVIIAVAGVVTAFTVMGGTLVAAQSGAFAMVTTSLQSRQTSSTQTTSQSSVVVDYYTQDGSIDLDESAEDVITETVAGNMPFRTKLYEVYNKLRTQNHGAAASHQWSISDTLTETLSEHGRGFDDDMRVISDTGTLTDTQHGGRNHSEDESEDDQGFHGFTNTLTHTHEIEISDHHGITVEVEVEIDHEREHGTVTNTLSVAVDHGDQNREGDQNRNSDKSVQATPVIQHSSGNSDSGTQSGSGQNTHQGDTRRDGSSGSGSQGGSHNDRQRP